VCGPASEIDGVIVIEGMPPVEQSVIVTVGLFFVQVQERVAPGSGSVYNGIG